VEYLYSALSFVAGLAVTLLFLDAWVRMRERSLWKRMIVDRQKAIDEEENDPIRRKVRLDRYV